MEKSNVVLHVADVHKRFGGLHALADIDLQVEEGKTHAIIGPNGAGKTTLIAQLVGELRPSSGSICFAGEDITFLPMPARSLKGLARSFQITSLCKDFSVLDNVALAIQAHQGHSFRFWRKAQNDRRLREPAYDVLSRVGLAERAASSAGSLAHGEQRQLEVAVALATNPRLLLLDEPMAGMGREDSARMVDFLKTLKRRYTILLIEHDMDAVFALADRISVLVNGRCIASGGLEEVRASAEVRQAYLGEERI